jgi:hypothetical protein
LANLDCKENLAIRLQGNLRRGIPIADRRRVIESGNGAELRYDHAPAVTEGGVEIERIRDRDIRAEACEQERQRCDQSFWAAHMGFR